MSEKICFKKTLVYVIAGVLIGGYAVTFLEAPFPEDYQSWWQIVGILIGGITGKLIALRK